MLIGLQFYARLTASVLRVGSTAKPQNATEAQTPGYPEPEPSTPNPQPPTETKAMCPEPGPSTQIQTAPRASPGSGPVTVNSRSHVGVVGRKEGLVGLSLGPTSAEPFNEALEPLAELAGGHW